jgi:hypothetical protein
MNPINHTIFFLILIIYIIFIIYLYNYKKYDYENNIENFTGLLDLFLDNNIKTNIKPITEKQIEPQIIKKNIKYIYIININNKKFKYYYLNKKNQPYMTLYGNITNFNKDIKLKDVNNNLIGSIINEKYNIYIFQNSIFNKNLNIHYINKFKEIKMYLDNDDKIFYIKKKNDSYIINLYNLYIGKIKHDGGKYRIMVYEDYKTYLNLFGLGLIFLLHES